jgi:ribonuclease HI
MKKIKIYCDGACSGNPGPGGWAAILIYNEHKKEISGFEKQTTNNRMELLSAINSLKLVKFPCEIELYSDSDYLIKAFNDNWISSWEKNNWINSKKEPVKNKELWEELIAFNNIHKIVWIKVKGHSNNEYNNRCDELATFEIKKGI